MTGGGLRTEQLIATLRTAKHSVIPVIEAAAVPSEAAGDWRTFGEGELAAVLRDIKPQIIVLEQWALASRLGDPADGGAPDVPLVIDLHGSLLLENVYRRGTTDLTLDGKTKLEALRRADLLVTPAPAQIHHFASWATLAGFDARELPLALLPLATTRVAKARSSKKPALKMVYGGARWPWIDSLLWLETAAGVAQSHKGARLDVFTYDPPRHGLPFEEDLGTWPDVDAALKGRTRKGVKLHGKTEHADFVDFLESEATVALDLWEPNPERMLASTTRTVEFLAAGLPVITTRGASWSEELVQAGAGWTVASGDHAELTALLEDLVAHPERIAEASRAALALASSRADLASSGAALLAFADTPSRPPRAPRSVVEAIVHVRQTHLDETLRSLEGAHRDEHATIVASHKAETAELRDRHGEEVEQLRAAHQAEVAELRADADARMEKATKRHDEQSETLLAHQQEVLERADAQHREVAARQEALMEEATASHRSEVTRIGAERRAEMEEVRERHQEELRALRSSAQEEVAALQDRLDAALAEASSLAEATRLRTEELALKQKLELEELRLRLEGLVAERQSELDGVRETLAERDQALRVMTEARDELKGRWTSDRAQDKEARTKLEVELRAEMTAREQQQRTQAAAELEALRAELTGQLEAMGARKVVRLADSVQGALRGEGEGPRVPGAGVAARILGETGRIVPAARLAKLWTEHALDREHD